MHLAIFEGVNVLLSPVEDHCEKKEKEKAWKLRNKYHFFRLDRKNKNELYEL